MIFPATFIRSIAIAFSILCLSAHGESSNDDGFISFSVDLIHRDSPLSPTYDSSLTPYQHLANALKRSHKRIHRFQKHDLSTQSPESDLTREATGEYIIKYSIGSPPFTTFGIADTGSDVTWTQCQPCSNNCYNQKLPLFNPKKSSSFKTVPCTSNAMCNTFGQEFGCDGDGHTCAYGISYRDTSFSAGLLVTDTLTLGATEGKNVSIPKYLFGCGFNNHLELDRYSPIVSGIVGLGTGKSSLISQLGSSIRGKFSYCLVPSTSNTTKSGKLNFGANAVVSGQGVVSTVLKTTSSYYLTLEGISVGNQRLGGILDDDASSSNNNSKANKAGTDVIIDSGSVFTFLPDGLYKMLEANVDARVKLPKIKDPSRPLSLCYKTKKDIAVPDVVFHFKGGDVKLKPENVFVRTGAVSLCLAFIPAANTPPVYGNIAQGNFLVGFDLEKKTVSFKPTDCSKA